MVQNWRPHKLNCDESIVKIPEPTQAEIPCRTVLLLRKFQISKIQQRTGGQLRDSRLPNSHLLLDGGQLQRNVGCSGRVSDVQEREEGELDDVVVLPLEVVEDRFLLPGAVVAHHHRLGVRPDEADRLLVHFLSKKVGAPI